MTILDYFNKCTSPGYTNTGTMVSYKIEDRLVYLQCSREPEDWRRNFDVYPVETEMQGVSCIIPRGFHEAVEEMKGILIDKDVDGFFGYSHGGAIAAILSGNTGKHTKGFGCPNFIFNPSKKQKTLFWNLEIYRNPFDLLGMWFPVYSKAGKIITLKTKANKPDGVSWTEWLSGHSPKMYRQNLEGV